MIRPAAVALSTSTLVGSLLCVALATPAVADDFTYQPPGTLVPDSGRGRVDETVYVPGMRFPIEATPAFANSQVYGHGGYLGPPGGQCDAANYAYPWWDNFCEDRSWEMPLCPAGTGHQGQDIRPASCADDTWWAVAAEDGRISSIGSYSVYLVADAGTRHRYLHMSPASLQVREGDRVTRGQRLGRVSNAFGGTPTTIHLHYDLFQNVAGVGGAYVPTYMSLVRSYEELLGVEPGACAEWSAEGGVVDDGDRCVQFFGPAASWRQVSDAGHGGDLRWTHGWAEPRSNWVRWTLPLVEAGTYEIEVYLLPEYARSIQAPYTVHAAGRELDFDVDQSGKTGWFSLGTFDFAADGDEWVAVGDDSGESLDLQRRIMADGLRATRIRATEDAGVPDVGSPDVASPDAGRPTDVGADVPRDVRPTDVGPGPDAVPAEPDVLPAADTADALVSAPDGSSRDIRPARDAEGTRGLPGATVQTRGCATAGTNGRPVRPWAGGLALVAGFVVVRRRRR